MLQTLLAEGRPLLADGATGTNLFAMGLASGEMPELWNADASRPHPGAASGLRRRRRRHHPDQQFRRQSPPPRAARRSRRAPASSTGSPRRTRARSPTRRARRVVVAGSVGPTGDMFAPLGPLTEDEAVEVFAEQIEGLREGGADVVWIETMSAAEEIRAAARAAIRGRHALHGDRELRHRGPHDDGASRPPRSARSSTASSRSRSPSAPIAASAPPTSWSRSWR